MWRGRLNIRRRYSGINPLVFQAHLYLRGGDFEAAANLFEQLAGTAEQRGLGRAPNLYVQAGRARLLAGEVEAGVKLLLRGLSTLAEEGRTADLRALGQQVIAGLRRSGFQEQARQMAAFLEETLRQPGLGADLMSSALPQLSAAVDWPVRCPSCGAPIKPKEMELTSSDTAVCNYCGGPVRGVRR